MNAIRIGNGRSALAGLFAAVAVAAVGVPTVAHGQVCNGSLAVQQFDPAQCSTTTSPCTTGELAQAILVVGQTLEQALERQGPFAAHEATAIGMELCRALAALHAAGLVHGDLKTANVMRETPTSCVRPTLSDTML